MAIAVKKMQEYSRIKRLQEAAPELLRALKALVSECEVLAIALPAYSSSEALKQARDAIATAEGS